MSPLPLHVGAGSLALLALIALRGKGWAYPAFVVLGLLYLPEQTHFHVHAPKCEQLLPTMHVLVLSLHNYAYIALFAGFYWMSWVQFGRSDVRGVWALTSDLPNRSEEHTSELQSLRHLVCRLLLEKKKQKNNNKIDA